MQLMRARFYRLRARSTRARGAYPSSESSPRMLMYRSFAAEALHAIEHDTSAVEKAAAVEMPSGVATHRGAAAEAGTDILGMLCVEIADGAFPECCNGLLATVRCDHLEMEAARPVRRIARSSRDGMWVCRRLVGWRNIAGPGCVATSLPALTLAAYAIPVSLAYAGLAGPAAAGRSLRLPARWARLRPVGFVASSGSWPHIGHLAHDCRNGGGDGGWRRSTLRRNSQPCRLHGGGALPVGLDITAQRAR